MKNPSPVPFPIQALSRFDVKHVLSTSSRFSSQMMIICLLLFHLSDALSVYIQEVGADLPGCGDLSKPCGSLSYGMKQASFYSGEIGVLTHSVL